MISMVERRMLSICVRGIYGVGKKRENCGSHPCREHAGTTMVVVSVTCGARGNTTSLTERAVVGGNGEVGAASVGDADFMSVVGFVCCCSNG